MTHHLGTDLSTWIILRQRELRTRVDNFIISITDILPSMLFRSNYISLLALYRRVSVRWEKTKIVYLACSRRSFIKKSIYILLLFSDDAGCRQQHVGRTFVTGNSSVPCVQHTIKTEAWSQHLSAFLRKILGPPTWGMYRFAHGSDHNNNLPVGLATSCKKAM